MMGDAADDLEHNMIMRQIMPGINASLKQIDDQYLFEAIAKCVWTTKGGQVLTFGKMALSHLRNVCRTVEKQNHPKAHQLRRYVDHRESLE